MSSVNEKLNQLVADSNVLFTKLHNYHWNIKGMQFYNVHAKTEELYDQVAVLYDDLAERLLQLGGTPVVTLKQILELSRIKEESKNDFDTKYVVEKIVDDFKFLIKEFKELSSLSQNDSTTAAFADDKIAFLEKEVWMLKALLG